MKTSIGRTLFLYLIVLLLLGTSNALSACDGNTVSSSFNFYNTKSSVQSYALSKSGSAALWATIEPTFSLSPGESKLVTVSVTVPLGTPAGVYSLRFSYASKDDLQSQTLDINVSSCHGITLFFNNDSINSCLNSEVVIPFTVRNSGNFVEEINLSSSVGSLSESFLTLGPNDSQVVNVVFNPSVLGINVVNVTGVYSAGNAFDSFIVNASECVSFTASLSQSYVNLCENENKVVSLIIDNGPGSRVYYFNSSSLLVDLPSSVNVGSNQKFSRDFSVYSSCESGIFNHSINVWTPGSRVVSVPLILNLRDCFKPIVSVPLENDVACSCENVTYDFTVFNPGSKAVTYALTSSVGRILLDGSIVSSVTIPVDGFVKLQVVHDIACDFSGSVFVGLTATAVHACAKSSSAGVNLTVNSWDVCERVIVLAPSNVPVNESDFSVPVNVCNGGYKPASFNIIVTGSAVSNLISVSKSFVTLSEPGECDVIDLTFSASKISGNYVVVEAFSTDNLASAKTTINFGGLVIGSFYYVLIGVGALLIVVLVFSRDKIFKRNKSHNVNAKEKSRK